MPTNKIVKSLYDKFPGVDQPLSVVALAKASYLQTELELARLDHEDTKELKEELEDINHVQQLQLEIHSDALRELQEDYRRLKEYSGWLEECVYVKKNIKIPKKALREIYERNGKTTMIYFKALNRYFLTEDQMQWVEIIDLTV